MATEQDIPEPVPIGKTILDIGVRHQVYLERLKAQLTREAWAKLESFEKNVTDWLSSQTRDLAEMTHLQAQRLLLEARQVQLEVLSKSMADVASKFAEVADYEAEFSAKTLEKITRDVTIKSLKAGKAYQAALQQPIPATGQLLESFVEKWSQSEVEAVGNLVSKGYAQGWTNQQIKQAVQGTKAANYTDGIIARAEANVEAVVHTSVQHIAQTARTETWARNADVVKWVRVLATLDSRTTPLCRSLDGRRYKLGEEPKFPAHVRCRTTTVPEVAEEFAFLDEGATRSAEFGPVSAKMSYYDWLATQDEEFQDEVLGSTRGQLFREGGLSANEFGRLNLGRNFEPLTLDEMRKKEPGAFKKAGL